MKKLLIIQQDEAYFLFETLQVLERYQSNLKDYEMTVLVEEQSFRAVFDKSHPVLPGITTDADNVKKQHFDISVNLSLNERTWDYHAEIKSEKKLGAYKENGQLFVDDLWSTYLLTLRSRTPFLTFHFQDIFRNILGFKGRLIQKKMRNSVSQLAYGMTATHLFSASEQEIFISELSLNFPDIPLKDITEIDLLEDVSHTLYIGPATLDALKFCAAGGKGVFLTSAFHGFNLLPYSGEHLILSTKGKDFRSESLLKFVEKEIYNLPHTDCPYSVYSIDDENSQEAYLKSHNGSDDYYPVYQAQVVLWNFLLNLHDTNLDVTDCSESQLKLLKNHLEVLTKFIRLHDYALVSIDTIYQESKSKLADGARIQGHMKNLLEIEKISEQISSSHPLLRTVIDFYRIRRGQNNGENLAEQSQNSLLVYTEEHQALQALSELFSVTLRKNTVNI